MDTPKKVTPLERFAKEFGLKMIVARELRALADLVAKAGERWSNYGDIHDGMYETAYDRAQGQFYVFALACGFDGYEMNGLYPTLTKGDRQFIEIPEDTAHLSRVGDRYLGYLGVQK